MILSLLFSVVGLKAVFDSHKIRGIPDLYSIHSWIGLVTVVLFACQVSPFLFSAVPEGTKGGDETVQLLQRTSSLANTVIVDL